MARLRWPEVAPALRGGFLGVVGVALAMAVALVLPAMVLAQGASPLPSPAATERPVPLDEPSRPVRVRVPFAGIDLPVISSERTMPGNPPGYPLCDVAQYWTKYDLPGEPGTTWVLAHAQAGMFLPLYTINAETNGRGLIGKLVKLQLRDGRLLTYRISETRISLSEDIADRPNKRQHRLILQTSTGYGPDPKLQVAARLVGAEWTEEPRPLPQPRACFQPAPQPTPKPRPGQAATPPPDASVDQGDDQVDDLTMLLGSGAVLLGVTVVAVYLVRRP
jgi:hypothetical protein